jgi:hypothetical protein
VIGVDVAEKHCIPCVNSHLQPVGTPTWQLPGVVTPWMPTWQGPLGRRAAQVLGVPARPRPADPALPRLYGFNPHVVPPPSDWPSSCRVTGSATRARIPGRW